MILTDEARAVLERSQRDNRSTPKDIREIGELIAMLPEDRVLLQKNVDSNPIGDLPRYSIHIRIQHLLTFTTFLLLAFTGMPVHYFTAFWAQPFNEVLGGIEVTRIIHRTLAATMIFTMVYHVFTLLLGSWWLQRQGRFDLKRTIVPSRKDITDFREDMRYFAGKRRDRPEMDKFMYKQKIHYFAAAFGNTVMITSGSAFLFPEIWASVLPGGMTSYFQEMMRLSHPHEALLALLAIAFWHWYNVHLAPGRFPMQWTFLTGRITREHQIEEHFLEYLRSLVEVPEERRVLRAMLLARRIAVQPAVQPAVQAAAQTAAGPTVAVERPLQEQPA